jgi:hypothetical protein
VSDLYIPRIGPHIFLRRIGRSILGIYKSLADGGSIPFLGIFVSSFQYCFFAVHRYDAGTFQLEPDLGQVARPVRDKLTRTQQFKSNIFKVNPPFITLSILSYQARDRYSRFFKPRFPFKF